MTPNQIVALRLRLARLANGWTQTEACDQLRRYGVDWSQATYSAAERSTTGTRTREFDADMLVAFSLTFGFELSWWLAPPPAKDPYGLVGTIATRSGKQSVTGDQLVQAILGRVPDALETALAEAFPSLSAATRALLDQHLHEWAVGTRESRPLPPLPLIREREHDDDDERT